MNCINEVYITYIIPYITHFQYLVINIIIQKLQTYIITYINTI